MFNHQEKKWKYLLIYATEGVKTGTGRLLNSAFIAISSILLILGGERMGVGGDANGDQDKVWKFITSE